MAKKRAPKKNPAAVALGKLGGNAALKKMTPEQRSERARKAAAVAGANRTAAAKERKL